MSDHDSPFLVVFVSFKKYTRKGVSSIYVRTSVVKLAKIDENGQIIDYIFMPSQRLFWEELAIFERKKKNAVWYSIHVLSQVLDLFDLKSFEKKHHSLLAAKRQYAAFFLEEDSYQFNDALESKDISNTRFDVEECKVHMHRIWKAVETKLLSESTATQLQKVAPSYNRYNGALLVDGINITFKPVSLRGKILTLLFPKGQPISTALSFDEIYEKAIEGEADPTWEQLAQDERQKIKDKIYEAAGGINGRVQGKTNRTIFIKIDNLALMLFRDLTACN